MKKFVAILGTVGILAFAFVPFAGAETASSSTSTPPYAKPIKDLRMRVEIGPEQALIRGFVTAVNSNSISVRSWGGTWIVLFDGDTQFLRRFGGRASSTEIKVDDFVAVHGKIVDNASWTIDARLINDYSITTKKNEGNATSTLKTELKKEAVQELQDAKENLKGEMNDAKRSILDQFKAKIQSFRDR